MRISKQTFKDWTLPLAIIAGVMSYFLYTAIPVLAPYKALTLDTIGIVQPTLLFAMLFVALCKVEPSQLRPHGSVEKSWGQIIVLKKKFVSLHHEYA